MLKLLIAMALFISGCASIHKYCQMHGDEYGGYQQCYAQEEDSRIRRQAALHALGSSLQNNNYTPQNKPTNCTTSPDGLGGYRTSCY